MRALLAGLVLFCAFCVSLGATAPILSLSSDETVQGGFLYGKTQPGTTLTLDGRPVLVSADGRFFLAFHYNAGPAAMLNATRPNGETEEYKIKVKAREFNVERIDGLPPAKVTAPPERQKRIAAESAKKSAARTQQGMQLDWTDGFIEPVKTYRVSGVYGSQRILNGVPKRPHYGIDMAAPAGTEVVAPAGGVVTLAESDFWYEGGLIFLDHGHGLQSAFLHLSAVDVEVGAVVKKGDRLGAVGSTGRSTGPHLDWRINWGKVWIDPQLLLAAQPLP